MSEQTAGPKQLAGDNGRSNWGGDFGRYGKGQPLGGSQPGEGVHPLPDAETVGQVSTGGASPESPDLSAGD